MASQKKASRVKLMDGVFDLIDNCEDITDFWKFCNESNLQLNEQTANLRTETFYALKDMVPLLDVENQSLRVPECITLARSERREGFCAGLFIAPSFDDENIPEYFWYLDNLTFFTPARAIYIIISALFLVNNHINSLYGKDSYNEKTILTASIKEMADSAYDLVYVRDKLVRDFFGIEFILNGISRKNRKEYYKGLFVGGIKVKEKYNFGDYFPRTEDVSLN